MTTTGGHVRIQIGQTLHAGHHAIVTGTNTDKDAGLAFDQGAGGQTSPFQRFPTRFEQQPMLGIDAHRFARGNAKEERVKASNLVEEGCFTHIHLAGRWALRVIEQLNRPAFVRDRLHHVRARQQQLPERFGAVRTGEATGHANHRDRFVQRRTVHECWQTTCCRRLAQRLTPDQIEQIRCQRIDRGIFKGNCRRQRAMQTGLQLPPQLQRHQRIHT